MDSSGGLAATLQVEAPSLSSDGASSLYHNSITPLIQRCASYIGQPVTTTEPPILSLAMKRALQHSENLKWQQDMFHRLLHLLYLSKEGLATEQQFASCKRHVLAFLESMHPDGEWPEFTRDKLLFLQDLLSSSCICESEYHASKKPLILRLADQGAIIDAEDFIFDSSSIASDAKIMKSKDLVRTTSTRRAKVRSMAESDSSRTPTRKGEADANIKPSASSPLKQVMGAVCRFNRTPSQGRGSSKNIDHESTPPKVPHALDFLRPEHCPVREAPFPQQAHQQKLPQSPVCHDNQEEALPAMLIASSADDHKDRDICNWFMSPPSSPKCNNIPDTADPLLGYSSPTHGSKSPAGGTPSRLREVLTGLMSKKSLQADGEKSASLLQSSKRHNPEGEEERGSPIIKNSKWGLDILRFPKKLQFEQEQTPPGMLTKTSAETGNGIFVGQLRPMVGGGLVSPITKNTTKKVHCKGASSDFFIDKVLGENIKNELSRIRAEMNKAQPGQTFSNEQIDAIATKLPMDKAELKKFFPQTWCEKYGEIVLDVVQKEFKEHVDEMQKFGKGRDKKQGSALSPANRNDENLESAASPRERRQNSNKQNLPRRNPDFSKCFTTLDENYSPVNNHMESPKSPSVEKSNCRPSSQQRHCRRLTKDMDQKLEEEMLKMPLRQMNEYGSHLRA